MSSSCWATRSWTREKTIEGEKKTKKTAQALLNGSLASGMLPMTGNQHTIYEMDKAWRGEFLFSLNFCCWRFAEQLIYLYPQLYSRIA